MIFYVGSGGEMLDVFPERVFQGSSNASMIRFVGAFASNCTVTLSYKLPNGVWTTPRLSTLSYVKNLQGLQDKDGTEFNAWEIPLDTVVTEQYGTVGVQFFVSAVRDGKAARIASARSSFIVEEGVPIVIDAPSDDYEALLQQILSKLSEIPLIAQETPQMDGVGAVGSSLKYARENHVHPTDTTRASVEALEELDDKKFDKTGGEISGSVLVDGYIRADSVRASHGVFDSEIRVYSPINPPPTGSNPSDTTPLMDSGLGTAGKSNYYSRGDHRHPSDTSRASVTQLNEGLGQKADKTAVDNEFEVVHSDIAGLRNDITNEAHFRGYLETNAEVQALAGTPNDYAYSAESGTVWIYQTDTGWTNSGKPVPDQTTPPSNATPLMDGTASAGSLQEYSRGDHRHPSDTTKLDKSGGTITGETIIAGSLKFVSSGINNNNSPIQYYLGMQSFADGGKVVYRAASDVLADLGGLPKTGGNLTGSIVLVGQNTSLIGYYTDKASSSNNHRAFILFEDPDGTVRNGISAQNAGKSVIIRPDGAPTWQDAEGLHQLYIDPNGVKYNGQYLMRADGSVPKVNINNGAYSTLTFTNTSGERIDMERTNEGDFYFVARTATGANKYQVSFPNKAGAIALKSDIPTFSYDASTKTLTITTK